MWVLFSQPQLFKKVVFPLAGLGTLVKNNLTIRARVYFWALFYSIGPYVCPYASTTVLITAALQLV